MRLKFTFILIFNTPYLELERKFKPSDTYYMMKTLIKYNVEDY